MDAPTLVHPAKNAIIDLMYLRGKIQSMVKQQMGGRGEEKKRKCKVIRRN